MASITDSKAREMIVKKLKTNLFVEASAGSGKTTSLVNRMVALVEDGVPVNKICTITFTVAAADEFFVRFQSLLSRRTIDNPNDPSVDDLGPTTKESRDKCLEALNNIDSCFSGTMDSFCNMVAHELPNELDIPSDAQVLSEEELIQIIKEEYFKILTDSNNELYELAGLFNKTFKNPLSIFASGMMMVSAYRDYKIAYDTDLLDSGSDHILDGEINDLIKLLTLIRDEGLDNMSDTHKKPTKQAVDNLNKITTDWKKCLNALSFAAPKINDKIKYLKSVEGTTLETDFLKLEKSSYVYTPEILQEIKTIIEKTDEYKFQLYFSFISKVRDKITENMKRNSQFSFFDFLYYLAKKFKESSNTESRELISHVFDRHSYILIDESQDTDPTQTQLFFYLAGQEVTDDWTKVNPRPGSLFIVGDPKQSIYRFRGADVNAYNHSREVFKDIGEVINLTKNFRSNVVVKEYFNEVMNNVLNIGDHPLTHPDIPLTDLNDKEKERVKVESSKEITLNGVYKYDTTNNKREDANNIINIIKKIVENPNYKIVAKKNNDIREIQYEDILVITRDKTIAPYIEEFSKNKIPLRVEAKIYFSNSPSVYILKKLLYLLFAPYKTQFFVDVVRSDLYKLNPQDIIAMKKDGFNLNISNILGVDDNPITFSNPRHKEIVNELHDLYEKTRGMTVSSTLFYLLSNNDFDFFKNISSDLLDYAYFMVEVVKAAEKDGTVVTFDDAYRFLENFINDDSEIEKIMKFSDNVNQVKISNLHKVKGLQAPIVILSECAVDEHKENKYVDRLNNVLYFNGIKVKREGKNVYDKICASVKYNNDIAKAQAESDAEARRIEYVAATRAESVLIIGHPTKKDRDQVNPWEHLYKDDLQDIPDFASVEHQEDVEQYDDVMKGYHSIVDDNCNKASYINRSPSELRLKSAITNVDTVKEKEDLDIDIPKTELGTLIHRLLECIVTSKNGFDIYSLVNCIFDEYEYSKDEKLSLYNLLTSVGNIFVRTGFIQTSQQVPQNLFEVLMNAEDVMCEVPFAYRSGDAIVSGIIDLLYKDSSGWHVIDYKTNMEGEITKLEEDYKGQLDVYRKAVKQATGLDCDAHIYHIETVNI